MKTVIYLIRHGDVENPEKVEYGRLSGFPLSDEGRKQAQAVAQEIMEDDLRICRIICSPLMRTVETAEIISAALGVPFATDERLTEWDEGPWEGRKTKDFAALSGYYGKPMKLDGLEPHEKAALRVISVIEELVKTCPGQKTAIVSHRESMASAVLKLTGADYATIHDLDMRQASVWELVFEGDKFISAKLKWDKPV